MSPMRSTVLFLFLLVLIPGCTVFLPAITSQKGPEQITIDDGIDELSTGDQITIVGDDEIASAGTFLGIVDSQIHLIANDSNATLLIPVESIRIIELQPVPSKPKISRFLLGYLIDGAVFIAVLGLLGGSI